MYDEFVESNLRHVRGVRKALLSIEKALKLSFHANNTEIDIFRAELIRRALCHDHDKFSDLANFAEYTIGTRNLIMFGAYNFEFGDTRFDEAYKKAYEGFDVLNRHKETNDHHHIFHCPLSKMTVLPLIEMVCDWYGSGYYAETKKDRVIRKFAIDSKDNILKFGLNEYQSLVCNCLRSFLIYGCDSIIRSLRDACVVYDNVQFNASDMILDTDDLNIRRKFFGEVHSFLSTRHSELNAAIAQQRYAAKSDE